ncbi:MAG: ABC transporter permease [Acidobacteriota bacterium]
METLLKDFRYAVRTLWRSPGFAAVVILTAALGIGANSAIFSVVDAVLLRPLPYQDPERLVMVWDRNPERGLERSPISYANYLDWAQQNSFFEHQAAYGHSPFNLSDGDTPERVWGLRASAGLFPALGIDPVLGRTYGPDEDRPGGERVVVLSHRLWQRRFGGDGEIVGRTVRLNGESFTVIGVMPAGFTFPQFPQNIPVDLWVPLAPFTDGRPRGSRSVLAVAKLKEGVTLEQAEAGIATIAGRLEREYPNVNSGWTSVLVPLHGQVVGPVRAALLTLFGAVGLVLLIACANIANLSMARAAGRQREIAVRAALGAGRLRLVRQLLTESLLLAIAGGALGLLLADWAVQFLVASSPGEVTRLGEQISIDWRMVGFTLVTSLVTGVLFGLIPALRTSRSDLHEALKEGGSAWAAGFRGLPVRSTLVVAQVALALVLLIGAGLLIRSLAGLMDIEPGFDTQDLLTMEILLPEASYPGQPQVRAFHQALLEGAGELPGVRSVATVNFLPLSGYSAARPFTIDKRPLPPGERPRAEERAVSPDYFRAMGITLVAGRLFTAQDNSDAPGVTIISESMARRYWLDEDPLGRRLTTSSLANFLRDDWSDLAASREIVGVVSDVHYSALAAPADDTIYLPYRQDPWPWLALVVKASADPATLVEAVRNQVRELDPNLALYNLRTMRRVISTTVAADRFRVLLLAVLAGLALALATVGIYGLVSFSIKQRTHEIGVRLALGARPQEVFGLVVRQGLALAAVGVAVGMLAAIALTRLLSSWLFGITATDPATFLGISLIMVAVAALACWLPARRAARVDPVVSLRVE